MHTLALALATELIPKAEKLSKSEILKLEPMTGDASGRQYFRIWLEKSSVKSAILMLLGGGMSPVGGGRRNIDQDDCYVEVGNYFSSHSIRIPELYLDARERKALLIEDVGSDTLLSVTQSGQADASNVLALYKKTLDVLVALQKLPNTPESVIFQRSTTEQQSRTQICEFLDYYAIPRHLESSHAATVRGFMLRICAAIVEHPRVVSHFDFMPANLHVLANQEICLIDFQDACLDSPMRDFYSILNDRGADIVLGRENQAQLIQYYLNHSPAWHNFEQLYNEYALHWDFRVSGRFAFLSEKKGLKRYETWIPSTLRRIGRTLARMPDPEAKEVLKILSEFSSEIQSGAHQASNWKVFA